MSGLHIVLITTNQIIDFSHVGQLEALKGQRQKCHDQFYLVYSEIKKDIRICRDTAFLYATEDI